MLIDNDYSPSPAVDVQLDGKTVTALNDRLLSLTLTDNRGFEADSLEIVLDDSDGKLTLPAKGVKISVSLGWNNRPLIFKGIYTVDEISHRGPPDQLSISARSADFRRTFNVKRDHSWHNITVSNVVAAIASRYELRAGVSEELAAVEIDHADQTNESDISFLTRMAEMLGAVATIKNGMILFITPGKGVSQSGKPLPVIEITRASGDKHSFRVADRDAYSGVSAYWLDLNVGKPQKVSIKRKRRTPSQEKNQSSTKEGNYLAGEEGNVFVMRRTYKTERAARRGAAAKWAELQRGAAAFSINLARGRADLFPDQPAKITGFKSTIDEGNWTITRCVHEVSGDGFTTALELEVRLTEWGESGE